MKSDYCAVLPQGVHILQYSSISPDASRHQLSGWMGGSTPSVWRATAVISDVLVTRI
jgi:hypothetical protein